VLMLRFPWKLVAALGISTVMSVRVYLLKSPSLTARTGALSLGLRQLARPSEVCGANKSSGLSFLSRGELLETMILNAFDEEINSSRKVRGYCHDLVAMPSNSPQSPRRDE